MSVINKNEAKQLNGTMGSKHKYRQTIMAEVQEKIGIMWKL